MVYVISGVVTVLMGIAGLALTCWFERRALSSRRKGRGTGARPGTPAT